jgi:hypothetical protein
MIATKLAAGIPTTYHGIRFRSRLEATWAAFFDQLRWEWVYEPFDCAGWIPDFALKSRTGSGAVASWPVLVEVKPTFELEPAVPGKIDAADMEHEVLLVGLGPLVGRGYGLLCIGWLRELVPSGWTRFSSAPGIGRRSAGGRAARATRRTRPA